jgi:hypothetical protein
MQALTPERFRRGEAGLSRETRARWEGLAGRLGEGPAFLVSDDRDELVPLYYLQVGEGRLRGVQPLFPNQTPGAAFANVVTVIEAAAPDRPLYLAKPMPGLEVKFRTDGGDPPRVLGSSTAGTPPFPVRADFGGRLALLGIDLAAAEVRRGGAAVFGVAGGAVDVTLRWGVSGEIGRDYATFVQAVAPDGRGLAGSDRRPGGAFYPSSRWRSGEVTADAHRLLLPAESPPGVYELRAGVYDPADLRRLPVAGGGDYAVVGSLTIPPPTEVPPRRLDGRFLTGIALEGTDLAPDLGRRAGSTDPLGLRLFWRAERPPERAYTVFVHLVDLAGGLVAQQDGEPLEGRYPTWAWRAGSSFADARRLDVGRLAPGVYRLIVGLYEPETGRRLALEGGGETVTVATMVVG